MAATAKGGKVVVTGASGGTGRAIVQVLCELGYEVRELDIENRGVTARGWETYKQVDLTNAAAVNDAFAGAMGVVHFGSFPGDGQLSDTDAWHNFMSAGFNVFNAAKNCGIKRIAWASSIEIYGDITQHPSLPCTEESPLEPVTI